MASYAKGAIALVLALTLVAFQWTTTVTKKRPSPAKPRTSTFFGQAWGHTDSASTAGPGPQAVTPPADMKSGDLVFLFGVNRSIDVQVDMGVSGGQTWDSTAKVMKSAANSGQLYWCKYNGTWSANPSLRSASGTTALTVGIAVFRPADTSAHVWAVHSAADTARYAAANKFTVTAKTTTKDSTVCFAVFYSNDDNAWSKSLTTPFTDGTTSLGWKNISGSDQSVDWQYRILAAAGSTGTPADSQIARGNDAGGSIFIVLE